MKNLARKIYRSLFPVPINQLQANITFPYPTSSLLGRKIAIIGSTRGIGKAMAEKFISNGADVIISGRSADTTMKAAKEIGCLGAGLDVDKCTDFSAFIAECVHKLGGLDTLVINAGISLHEGDILKVTPDQFDQQISINLRAAYFAAQAFIKYILDSKVKPSNLLFVSSERGEYVDMLPYGLTKAAMNSLVKGLARRCITLDMRVNAIAPGVTATDLIGYKADGNLYREDQMTKRIYLPQEMAEVAHFLISNVSNCLTGQIIVCNEGKSINSYF